MKTIPIAEAFRQLDLSDKDCFDDNDSDRDSNKELDAVERVSDVHSETTENQNLQTAWWCHASRTTIQMQTFSQITDQQSQITDQYQSVMVSLYFH